MRGLTEIMWCRVRFMSDQNSENRKSIPQRSALTDYCPDENIKKMLFIAMRQTPPQNPPLNVLFQRALYLNAARKLVESCAITTQRVLQFKRRLFAQPLTKEGKV